MDKMQSGAEASNRVIAQNWHFTVMMWLIICAGVFVILFAFAGEKTAVQNDSKPMEAEETTDKRGLPAGQERELTLVPDTEKGKNLTIFLPEGVRAEEVLIENRYVEGALWVYIPCDSQEYFANCEVSGNVEIIDNASCKSLENAVLLVLHMKQLFEFTGVIENEELVLSFENPLERYSQIAVLEVTGISAEGCEVAETVAQFAKEKLSETEVWMFVLNEAGATEKDCLEFLEKVGADIFLQVSVSEKKDAPEEYGISCYYNEEYYIPGFGNLQLADTLAISVAYACNNRVLGLYTAGEESFLKNLQFPGTRISIGNLENIRERELLLDEGYQEKVSEGIANAILESFQEMEESDLSKLINRDENLER